MSATPHDQLPMIERMERAIVLLANFIELDGDIHIPMYEKFKAELNDLKATRDTGARTRGLLRSYSKAGALKEESAN